MHAICEQLFWFTLFKSSLSQLQTCIERQDWESATRHCARAMSLPLEVISGPFAETSVVRFSWNCAHTRLKFLLADC